MLLQNPSLQIWLYNQPTDMRKQFNGLIALAHSKLNQAASSGALFVFINRNRTMMKVLYYSHGGYCLWCKRLERGRFHRLHHHEEKVPLNWAQLHCLIEGIDWQRMRKNKRLNR